MTENAIDCTNCVNVKDDPRFKMIINKKIDSFYDTVIIIDNDTDDVTIFKHVERI